MQKNDIVLMFVNIIKILQKENKFKKVERFIEYLERQDQLIKSKKKKLFSTKINLKIDRL